MKEKQPVKLVMIFRDMQGTVEPEEKTGVSRLGLQSAWGNKRLN